MSLLSANKIVKNYASHRALNGVSIEIPPKSIFGLLGPNGAGKTSLIRIITQITGPDEGEVFFKGQPLNPNHIAEIGYMPEERGLYKKMKVGEQLVYLAQLKGMKRPDAVASIKEWLVKFEIKDWWNKNVEDLSKGMQQKVQFIATVVNRPPLIILDEPFTGFDPVNANLVKDEIIQLKNQGSAIIFSTHRMESVEELCDNIALIHKSEKILDGTTQSIRNQFRTNTWQIEGSGIIGNMHPDFEVLKMQDNNGLFKAEIRVKNGQTANSLLAWLLPQTEITHFQERIPSINDIFIAKVTGKTDLLQH
jgi:ABC-2 type transport system ATP-binding protein